MGKLTDEDVSGGEEEVRPSTNKLHDTAYRVVLRVDIEEALDRDTLASRVFADGANVVYPDTSTIVALVGESINDVQVVVNTLAVSGVECSGGFRVAQVGKVDDVGDWATGRSWTDSFLLIELVVKQNVLVPVALCPPTLMAVCSTWV